MNFKKAMAIIGLFFLLFPLTSNAIDSSKSSVVIDIDTGRVLYEKNANEKRLIASTTKIMTAILTLENASLKEKVKVGDEVLKMYGTNIYIEVGETMTIEDLLYGLLLRSGNDAAITLATYIGGTEENFVKMMNDKAKELEMNNTKFENPHGLDDETKNYSTAYDMSLLSRYAMSNKDYKRITKTKKYKTKTANKSYIWYNRNKLLSEYEYCTGGKNGYTPAAGRTLVTTASKNNLNLTAVTLNDPNEYITHESLYNDIYSKYKLYKIIDKDKFLKSNPETKSMYLKSSFYYPLTAEENKRVTTKIKLLEPDTISEKAGYIKIELENNIIGIVDIFYKDKSEKKEDSSIFQKIKIYLTENLKKLMLGRQNSLNPGPLVPIPLEIYNSESFIL